MGATVVAGTVAGTLAADSRLYGSRPVLKGVEFIQGALIDVNGGLSPGQIVAREVKRHNGKVNIMGFARPIAKGDERVIAMERVTSQLGFERGPHLSLVYQIDEILQRDYNESMNINAFVSSFLSDQGYTAKQIYELCSMLVMSGVTACFLDAESKKPEQFLPLMCSDIDYQGVAIRALPD
jgi:citrate synthase